LDDFLAYFKLDFSRENDCCCEDGETEPRERAVYISCEFSQHKPNAQLKLHPYNTWILGELGLDSMFSGDFSVGDLGELLLLIMLIGAADAISMLEFPVQGHWEGNTFSFVLKDFGNILDSMGSENFMDGFSGGIVSALVMTLLMEFLQHAEFEYLMKTEVVE
jgi:hypothetical protein